MLKSKNLSTCAMILGAGMGTRMRPLTDHLPKPLVRLKDMPLIDHVIGRLTQAGIESIAVNVHYLADQLEAYLQERETPRAIFSDERAQILDSGYGAKRMLPHVKEKPFLLANSDTVWREAATQNVPRMIDIWDEQCMDVLLMLAARASSIGYEGRGDFHRAPDGKLSRRMGHEDAALVYAGVAIIKPQLFDDTPDEPFSLNLLFNRAIESGRLYGTLLDGVWMHVGTPQALLDAEKLLAESEK